MPVRLFVALWPSGPVVEQLAALPRPAMPGLRWTRPEQWHVTLAFLGSVPEAELRAVEEVLAQVAAAGGPVEVRLGPSTQRLGRGVLCLPARGVAGLAEMVRGALRADAGTEPGGPFRGHLTLGRAARGRSVPGEVVGRPLAAGWEADELCLVASTLDGSGSRYRTIGRWVLTSPDDADGRGPASARELE